MKHLKLILDFFYRNKLKSFLVLVIMTSAMIIFSTAVSQIRYYFVSLSYFDKPEFEDGLYLQTIPWTNDGSSLYTSNEILDNVASLQYTKGIAGFSSTSAFYNETTANIFLTNEFTAREFKPNISEGHWLDECEEGDIPNVVLGGMAFKNVSVGDNIELTGREFKNGKQKFHVIGKLKYPYYCIQFNSTSGGTLAFDLIDVLCPAFNAVFLMDDNYSLFSKDAISNDTFFHAILSFNENTTNKEKDMVKNELEEFNQNIRTILKESENVEELMLYDYPAYLEFNDILDNTKTKISDEVNKLIPFNAFVLLIATASAMIVSLLCVKQKQQNDYVAFLCGCSKRKNLLHTFLAIALLTIIPTVLTMLYIAFVPTLAEAGIIHTGIVYFDIYSYLYVIVYAAFILAVSFLVSSFSIIRKQPIDLYRKRMKG